MAHDKEINDSLLKLLLSMDVVVWQAQFMARRMSKCFGEKAFFVIGAFRSAGWSFEDLYQMDQISNRWRNSPPAILLLERLLRAIGLPELHARRMAMEPRLYTHPDFGEILHKVFVFRSLGLSDNELFRLAGAKPGLFITPLDAIEAWILDVKRRNRDPRHNLQFLKPPRPVYDLVAIPIPGYWEGFDLRLENPSPERPAREFSDYSERFGPYPYPNPPPVIPSPEPPAPIPQPQVTPADEVPACITPQLALEPIPDQAEEAVLQEFEEALPPSPRPQHEEPNAKIAIPAAPIPEPKAPETAVAETYGYDMVTDLHHLVMTLIEQHDQAWLEKNRRAFMESNPWLENATSATWETIRLLKDWFGLRASLSNKMSRLEFLASFLRNDNLPAKKRLRKLRIQRAALKRRMDPFSQQELKALDRTIAGVEYLADPNACIAKWNGRIADLEKKIKKAKRSNNGSADIERAQAKIAALQARIAKAERYGNLRAFLQLEPEIAYLRLYMARSILEYDAPGNKASFLRRPEFLLHPFETVEYADRQDVRRFSFPPPAALDMKTIQAKCTELRFRVNELRRYTNFPWKKQFVAMLCEPSRTRFLELLQSHLKKRRNSSEPPPPIHRRRGKTAFSTLV